MKFSWNRIGKIFDPTTMGNGTWMVAHAQCPTPFLLNEKTLRIFFATRPNREASGASVTRPGYVDIAVDDYKKILRVSDVPVLDLGGAGTFDEFGVMPSCVVRDGERILLYYTGWTRLRSVPYATAIGVAESNDNGESFHRIGPGPILTQTLQEPILVNSPIVRIIDGVWHMWYVSGTTWIKSNQSYEIEYRHAHAISADGITWNNRLTLITPQLLPNECQDQLCPFQIGDLWHAFFSVRNAVGFRNEKAKSYRLNHAQSNNLVHWSRTQDVPCLERPTVGWDSEMICSTYMFEHDGRHLMFYCGNNFGREGFGLAELIIN